MYKHNLQIMKTENDKEQHKLRPKTEIHKISKIILHVILLVQIVW